MFVGTISTLVTYKIQDNAVLKNKISQIILLQHKMSRAIKDIDQSATEVQNSIIEKRFNKHELEFERLKNSILEKRNKIGILNTITENKNIRNTTKKQLEDMFLNEKSIELIFDEIYKEQKKYISLKNKFDSLYPLEKSQRYNIYEKIVKNRDFTNIINIGLTQYYSKEALYQHKSKKSLQNWIDSVQKIISSNNTQDMLKELANYNKTVLDIGNIAINLHKIENKKEALLEKTNRLLESNRVLVTDLFKHIEELTSQATNRLFLISTGSIIVIILFITTFGFFVAKNIGLSVDEIEEKIHEGLKEIKDLNKEIELTQKEVIFTMGTIAEYRSKETGNHVKRVAEYSKILALHCGLNEAEAEMLKQASPMHDIGKVAIPDAVLNKPGRFNKEERETMNKHAFLGYEMLNKSKRPLLKTASIVAYEHHEKWDGSGHPRGLKEENIHIYGRITALADVFDALGSDRVYKKAWENEKIYKLFKEERGKHFDPRLIDIFFENLDEFLEVQSRLNDI